METIHLVGADDVRSAGSSISSAAEKIYRAANIFDSVSDQLRRALDEHAGRIEQAMSASDTNVAAPSASDNIQSDANSAWLKYYDEYSIAHPGYHPNAYERESFIAGFVAASTQPNINNQCTVYNKCKNPNKAKFCYAVPACFHNINT